MHFSQGARVVTRCPFIHAEAFLSFTPGRQHLVETECTNLRQKDSESINVYVARIKACNRRRRLCGLTPFDDKALANRLSASIAKKFRAKVDSLSAEVCTNFKELKVVLHTHELTITARDVLDGVSVETTGKKLKALVLDAKGGEGSRKGPTCWDCGSTTHLRGDPSCTKRQLSQNQKNNGRGL